MRKTESPHKLSIVFDSSEGCTEVNTHCSCKAGAGKCQHLAALFTHVTVKLRDDDSPTSHLQQWHKPRGPSLEPQRWFTSEFVKPRIDRKPREVAPKKTTTTTTKKEFPPRFEPGKDGTGSSRLVQ